LGRTRLQHGGRGVRNMVDHALINPLSRALFDQEVESGSTVRLLELVDKGEDATARFVLKIAVEKPAPSSECEVRSSECEVGESKDDNVGRSC